jgi:predicted permease
MSDQKFRRYDRVAGPDLEADVRVEIEFHIHLMTQKYLARGFAADDARTRALTEFGDMARARETCMAIGESQERMHRRAEVMGNFWQDLRHGARRLMKNPGFTFVTVLTLAIGLGPNIAIFSIINSVLLKPLPYHNPDQLVAVYETFPLAGGRSGSGSVSASNFADWKSQNRTFETLALANFTGSANLGDKTQPERLSVAAIDASVFPMLGVSPLRGRVFREDEMAPNGPHVAIMSETFWRRKYNADEAIVGSRLEIDGFPTEIVGIMPSSIIFPNRSAALDLWVPLQIDFAKWNRGSHAFRVIGRLKPGVTQAAAAADLKLIAARLAQQYPVSQEGRSVDLIPLIDTVVPDGTRKQLLVFLGAAALVLLIACANTASLMLARAAGRYREVSVLAALGASRGRVAQQFLVESLLVAIAGSLVGFLLAMWAVKGILVSAGTMVPRTTEIHFDGRVVLFVGGAILLTTVICGVVPALWSSRTNLSAGLRQGGRTGTSSTAFRNGLVVGQFALSLVLLIGAGLLLRTFAALMSTNTGMQVERVMTMRLPVPVGSDRYPTGNDVITKLYTPLISELRATPGVQSLGFINRIPLQEYGNNGNFQVVGKTYASVAAQPFAEARVVTPGYFATMGIPIRRGRDVAEYDDANSQQVAVINEEIAKKYFPGEDPIGKQVSFGPITPQNPAVTIVGIIGNVRQATLDREPLAEMYFPYRQAAGATGNMGLVIKTTNQPESVVKTVESILRRIDPLQPIFNVKTMREIAADSVSDRRLYLRLLAAFAAVALLLAIAGIYGVISFSVTQRTREFGIRLALGSEGARIKRMVVWHGARLAMTGLLIGLPAAFLVTRIIAGVLYGVDRLDPLTYAVVALILAVVALVASYVPARRAVKVDPLIAMRAE